MDNERETIYLREIDSDVPQIYPNDTTRKRGFEMHERNEPFLTSQLRDTLK